MASEQAATKTLVPLSKYSKRVILKTVLEGGIGFVGQRIVIGGWVKSSNEVRKEPLPPPAPVAGGAPQVAKDVSCVEILQTRIPFFRSIMKALGGNHPVREKLESAIENLPPPPSAAFLQVSDGSCVASLQVYSIWSLSFVFFAILS